MSNLELAVDLDAERALGLPQTILHASLLHNNRSTFTDRLVGDYQTVSNIDTDGSLRLKELWIDHRRGDVSLKAGLIDLNTEFDAIQSASLFINSSFGIGPDFSQAGENGPSIFPVTGLGLVGRATLTRRLELRAGLFEGTPGHATRPRRMRIHLGDEGALFVGELGYATGSGRFSAGIWRLADNMDRFEGGWKPIAGGAYVSIDQTLVELRDRKFGMFARVGLADADVYQIASFQSIGFSMSGPLLGAKDEQLGIAIASARNGRPYLRAQQLDGSRSLRRETALELTYRAQLTPFFAVQPDIQYIRNPGMDASVNDALAIGLRIALTWSS